MSKQHTRCPNCNDGKINITLGEVTDGGFKTSFEKCDKCKYVLTPDEANAYMDNNPRK